MHAGLSEAVVAPGVHRATTPLQHLSSVVARSKSMKGKGVRRAVQVVG